MKPETILTKSGLIKSRTRGQLTLMKGCGRKENLKLILIVTVLGGITTLVNSAVADYEDLVKSFNPVAYWRFNDASSAEGAIAADSSSTGAHSGIYHNGVTLISTDLPGVGTFSALALTSSRFPMGVPTTYRVPIAYCSARSVPKRGSTPPPSSEPAGSRVVSSYRVTVRL